MSGLDVHITEVDWDRYGEPLRALRREVLIVELGGPPALESDAEDPAAKQLIALNSAGMALGCARLHVPAVASTPPAVTSTGTRTAVLDRIAVSASARRTGLGSKLVRAALDVAEQEFCADVTLLAHHAAVPFYKSLGFLSSGDPEEHAGIQHVPMTCPLAIPFDISDLPGSEQVRTAGTEDAPAAASVSDTPLPPPGIAEFNDEAGAIAALHRVLADTRRLLQIYSPTLDHTLFDSPECAELISEFVRRAPGCRAEILINDSGLIVARGHALLDLSRRLDDKLQIRRIAAGTKPDAQSWLASDRSAVWVQSEPEDYIGWFDRRNSVQGERFGNRFKRFWDRSEIDPELRQLKL